MEISVEAVGPCKAKVSIVVPPERVKEELENSLQQTTRAVTFPGFRKGKAPKKLVLKRFGEMINEDVKEKLIKEALSEAFEKHNLDPVGEPDLDPTTLDLKEDAPFELKFEVETRPTFELGEYKEVEVELDPISVSDSDIDEAIMALRSRYAYLRTVEEGTIEKKHYLTADLTYKVEGNEDLVREGCQGNLSLGIVDGVELGDRIDAFIGKRLEDKVEFDVPSLPSHFLPETLRGKPAKVQAQIKEIREVAFPEVDDDFIKKIGMNSVEELRQKTEEEISKKKQGERDEEIERKVIDVLIERHPFEIPDKLLMQQITSQEQNLRAEMLRLGMPPEKLEEEAGKFDDKNRAAADRNIRSSFLFDKIAEKEDVYVTENEIEDELSQIAKQQGKSLNEIQQYYEENRLTPHLRSLLRNQKIRKLLRESAKLVEKTQSAESPKEDEPASNSESGTTI
jgi:trigger factor